MAQTLGAAHLASENWEVQRQNNFEISIAGVGGRALTLAVESGFLPAESNEIIELNFGNSKVKVAGIATFEDGTLVVKDIIQQDTEKVIRDWRKQVYNPETDAVGLAVNYKKQARVIQWAPDGSLERTWKIIGAWPSTVNYGTLDYTASDKKTIEITLTYDKALRI
jgi:hypothetical protein